MKISSLGITRAASYWYPTMLAEAAGEIGEAKAAERIEWAGRSRAAIQAFESFNRRRRRPS